MKSHYYKDLKKRLNIKKKYLIKLICFFFICNNNLIQKEYSKILLKFFFFKKMNFELKNHCILTKNTKTVYRFSSLTRTNWKSLIEWGYLNGIHKYSW